MQERAYFWVGVALALVGVGVDLLGPQIPWLGYLMLFMSALCLLRALQMWATHNRWLPKWAAAPLGAKNTMTDKPAGNSFNITGDNNRVANVHVGDVNIDRRIRRSITDDLRAGLRSIAKDRPVHVMGLNGDSESMAFARQIHDFLKGEGYSMTNPTAMSHMFFDPPVFTVKVSVGNGGKEWWIVVGPAE